jgi:hypothetical protein
MVVVDFSYKKDRKTSHYKGVLKVKITDGMTEDGRWYFTITDLEDVQTTVFSDEIVGEKDIVQIATARTFLVFEHFVSPETDFTEINYYSTVAEKMERDGGTMIDALKEMIRHAFDMSSDPFTVSIAEMIGKAHQDINASANDWPPMESPWDKKKVSFKDRMKELWSALTGGAFEMKLGKENKK